MTHVMPSDYLHSFTQGLVSYILGWTLQLSFVIKYFDEDYTNSSMEINAFVRRFPGHNSYHPVRHVQFEDVTDLLKEEKRVKSIGEISYDKTGLLTLTESWKLLPALFQVLFSIITGKVFPADLNWFKKVCGEGLSFNMERCVVSKCNTVMSRSVLVYTNQRIDTLSD